MRARRLTATEVARIDPAELEGGVLVTGTHGAGERFAKGTRMDSSVARAIVAAAAAGTLAADLRVIWADAEDMHEEEAAGKLALAVGGAGVDQLLPRQGRLELVSKWDGVLHVRHAALASLNGIDAVEVFTLFHGQCVDAGEVVAAVKVVPHVVPAETVRRAVRLAREEGPLVEVRPYQAHAVAALVCEPLLATARERLERVADAKLSALGSTFSGVIDAWHPDPGVATAQLTLILRGLGEELRRRVVLVTGVSAGDPLSPFSEALLSLGGRFLRRGLPVHPGSMLWVAELGQARFLGLPGCGMLSMATAADLVLPRLLTGENLDEASLAELGHGGVLSGDMRFRMPGYAQGLELPDHPKPSTDWP